LGPGGHGASKRKACKIEKKVKRLKKNGTDKK
jgi:hypothetical protein